MAYGCGHRGRLLGAPAAAAHAFVHHWRTVSNGPCLAYRDLYGRSPCEFAGDLRPLLAYSLASLAGVVGVGVCLALLCRTLRYLHVKPGASVRGWSGKPS